MLRSLGIVVFGSHPPENQEVDFTAYQDHIEHIRVALTDATFGLIDGFQWHIGYWRDPDSAVQFENVEGWVPELATPKLHTILPDQKFKFGQFIPPDCAHFVETIKPKNYKDIDARSFMTLSNIEYLLNIVLPEFKTIFKSKFGLDVSPDEQVYYLSADADNDLTSNYLWFI